MSSKPCLLFHKITPRWEAGVTWTTPDQFRRMLVYLADHGWRAADWALDDDNGKSFYLAIDDGYQCTLDYAFPVLRDLGWTAALFIPTMYIGRMNDWDHQFYGRRFRHLDWNGLRVLSEAGWTIGSHAHSHRALTGLSPVEVVDELTNSKRILEEKVGRIDWISFPFGRVNDCILTAAQNVGYRGVVVNSVGVTYQAHLSIMEADPVYLWDWPRLLPGRLQKRGQFFQWGRTLRQVIRASSGATILWRQVFPAKQSDYLP